MEDYDAPEVGTHPQISFLKKGPPQSANPTALSLTFKEVTLITEAMTEGVPFSYVLIFLLLPTTDWTTSGSLLRVPVLAQRCLFLLCLTEKSHLLPLAALISENTHSFPHL